MVLLLISDNDMCLRIGHAGREFRHHKLVATFLELLLAGIVVVDVPFLLSRDYGYTIGTGSSIGHIHREIMDLHSLTITFYLIASALVRVWSYAKSFSSERTRMVPVYE